MLRVNLAGERTRREELRGKKTKRKLNPISTFTGKRGVIFLGYATVSERRPPSIRKIGIGGQTAEAGVGGAAKYARWTQQT